MRNALDVVIFALAHRRHSAESYWNVDAMAGRLLLSNPKQPNP
jgi:hypothetical protein